MKLILEDYELKILVDALDSKAYETESYSDEYERIKKLQLYLESKLPTLQSLKDKAAREGKLPCKKT